jgi:hypothetical protein
LGRKEKWSERQDSNLQQTVKNKENPRSDTQNNAQASVSAWHDLSLVVAAWPKIPAGLKAAILAIVGSVDSSTEGQP